MSDEIYRKLDDLEVVLWLLLTVACLIMVDGCKSRNALREIRDKLPNQEEVRGD